MISTALWRKLGGFDSRYFMYGEEVDLCLRAAALGYRPIITPEAQIMHLGGASAPKGVRILQIWKASLVCGHWPKLLVPVGLSELWLCCATRALASAMFARFSGQSNGNDDWQMIWATRHDWLKGY
jgi:N-acetylglucosaminyl-diphospho-decaprenol L-rhamnosyltransferase